MIMSEKRTRPDLRFSTCDLRFAICDAPQATPKSLDDIVALLEHHKDNAAHRLEAIKKKEADLAKVFKKLKKDDPQALLGPLLAPLRPNTIF